MPQMNGTGPKGDGSKTGRGLGKCRTKDTKDALADLGTGKGLRHNAGGGKGKGKRLRSGLNSLKK